jgi:deoxyribodipyrimidine photo-lyase
VNKSVTLVWLRQDLRLADQPALLAAFARGGAVVPVFVWDPAGEGPWALGAASEWWLHHSLKALQEEIASRGGRVIIRRGDSARELTALIESTGATAVYWNRRYEPESRVRDAGIKTMLRTQGVEAQSFSGALLHEPHTIRNKQGGPFQVFTPYWRHCLQLEKLQPSGDVPARWSSPPRWPNSVDLVDLELLPKRDWANAFALHWVPGERGARAAMAEFANGVIEGYGRARDFPAERGTSRLSPHLHWGEISPRQVWATVAELGAERGIFPPSKGAQVYLSEIGWREFGYQLLYNFERTPTEPLRPEYAAFPWRDDPSGGLLKAWQRGQTGYPIVDAGMRELWATGWMHNRVRMIVGSFLVKHLRLPWQHGAAWFWDTLLDADLASNTLGWQWSAGCGADAAPYFRIFAPVLQGQRFDGGGDYVRRWVPEIAGLPNKFLHAPWDASIEILDQAGVTLGQTYPHPIVDHAEARAAALAAYQMMRAGGRSRVGGELK